MTMLKRAALGAALLAAATAISAAPAAAALSPDPYRTTSARISFSVRNYLGTSSCVLRDASATLTGTAGGAIGDITGFRPHVRYVDGCRGSLVVATYSAPMTVAVDAGNATFTMPIVLENTLGGICRYVPTLSGTVANGGNTVYATGQLVLDARLSGSCFTTLDGNLVAEFPGATISW